MRFLVAIIIQTSLNVPKLQTCVMAKNGDWNVSDRKFSTFQESLDFTSLSSCFMYFIRKKNHNFFLKVCPPKSHISTTKEILVSYYHSKNMMYFNVNIACAISESSSETFLCTGAALLPCSLLLWNTKERTSPILNVKGVASDHLGFPECPIVVTFLSLYPAISISPWIWPWLRSLGPTVTVFLSY